MDAAQELLGKVLPVVTAGEAETRFSELPSEKTGVEFSNIWKAPREFERALSLSFGAGGVAIGDYDADGLPDLYLTRPFDGGRLYRNLGGFKFKDVTESCGLGGDEFWQASPSFADIDGDGDLDLYVCAFNAANRLYLNKDGKFRECAKEAGLDFKGFSVNMAFADYDLDGDLDGYLLTNRPFSTEDPYSVTDRATANRVYRQLDKDDDGNFVMPGHLREIFDIVWNPSGKMHMFIKSGQYDHLYRNDGASEEGGVPRFTDVTEEAGLMDNGMGLSATWMDYDSDGDPDLYVANDYYGADHLYRNEGDGTFAEVTGEALPHTPWYSMGSNVADINNDGLLDFMGSDMMGTNHFRQKVGMGNMSKNAWFLDHAQPRQYMRNAVYVNTGRGRFMEAAHMTGLAKSDWTWALKFGDLDNDGHVDLFIGNGMTGDFFNSDITAARRAGTYLADDEDEKRPEPKKDTNLAFRNLGDLKFENVGEKWGLAKSAASFGAAMGDLDGDGDLDLVVNNFEDPVSIYRNETSGENHRVKIRLVGKKGNRFGIGATLRATMEDGKILTRYLTLSRGFYASDEPVVYFGLGKEAVIKKLAIDWPGGATQIINDLAADRFYTIAQPESFEELRIAQAPGLYRPLAKAPGGKHLELNFDDFERQPLLPNKHSQLGPGVAWGDVDGDGDDDLFIGEGRISAGRMYFNENGKFVDNSSRCFSADKKCEDMAPVFFDADGDGDRDLYVVSGGVECEPGDAVLADRLYLNDGKGNFTKAPEGSLPNTRDSGSVACAADFDRDGDTDLFVGGRVIPGRYPEVPTSHLLLNDGKGKFSESAPESLSKTGLVTSALWSDVDGDGWVDLLVTHEWGPVKVFQNQKGSLVDVTEGSGIGNLSGWWNSIAAGDVDADGDLDFAVGNMGLNSKYHANEEHPALLYYGDMDDAGRPKIVEAEFEGKTLYPVRGRSCSSSAMPGLKDKFPTFKSFAIAPLDKIYEGDKLATSKKLSANTLESGILINVSEPGSLKFKFRPLPRIAQISPIFGMAFTSVDGDQFPELYLVQNFFGPQRETGRMNGGVSILLKNDGGEFRPIWPSESHLVVPGDATALTVADLNNDGRPDFHVAVNGNRALAFEADPKRQSGNLLCLQLRGKTGNVDASGAKVSLVGYSTQQVSSGGGYLSQSSSRLYFPVGNLKGDQIKGLKVRVTWPSGKASDYLVSELTKADGRYMIEQD